MAVSSLWAATINAVLFISKDMFGVTFYKKLTDLFFFSWSFLTGNKSAKFSYGYASFKGKRASMEDFYETRISEVEGQMVAFFGVFDGISQYFLHIVSG